RVDDLRVTAAVELGRFARRSRSARPSGPASRDNGLAPHATIQAADGPGDVAPGEMVLDAADGPRAQLLHVRGVPEYSRQPAGQGRGVPGRHEVARLAVDHGGTDAADRRPDDWGAAGHRLKLRDPEHGADTKAPIPGAPEGARRAVGNRPSAQRG